MWEIVWMSSAWRRRDPRHTTRSFRYSDIFATLHSRKGEEFPLASDATQRQFDEIRAQPNFKELFSSFKSLPGVISAERVEQLGRDLRVPVVPIAVTRFSRPSQPGPSIGRLVIIWGHSKWCYGKGFCRIIKCDDGHTAEKLLTRLLMSRPDGNWKLSQHWRKIE